MRNKHLCVHGHFYQPPRENPWLDAVETEESAHPYPNWNEKIFQECYGPNSACPLLDENGLIVEMADNYRRMSFDFGPTLLSWLEREHAPTYGAIIAADRASCEALDGHGNAIAHPYYHAILPLQNARDKRTLVRWGMDDFRLRFNREPEGMWLPETAVDEETLEVLIEEGIRFTILSPTQAARVRDLGGPEWKEVTEENLLPTRPYRWVSRRDPERHIAVFFYHRLLRESVEDGKAFRTDDALFQKAQGRYHPDDSTQLVSVATDGEFYGHHRRAGAAALAQTFRLAQDTGLTLTNYAHYLSLFPPPQEVELKDRTAWSCAHGLGRWSADCGCRHSPKTNQNWRAPLREALDWLAGELDRLYAAQAGNFFKDFWAARDSYARRLLDLSAGNADDWLSQTALPELSAVQRRQALALLEMQRSRLAMYTSCGWFYDDVAGIETALILRHAARAIGIAETFGEGFSNGFQERLSRAPSNSSALGDARNVYVKMIAPGRADLARAAAHFALLDHIGAPAKTAGAFTALRLGGAQREVSGLAGKDRSFSWNFWELRDALTLESTRALAVVHQRDRVDLKCCVGRWAGAQSMGEELANRFETLAVEEFESELSRRFSGTHFGLEALFGEEKLNALRRCMPVPLESFEHAAFRKNWAAAIKALRGGGDGGDILSLLEGARRLKLPASQLPWTSELRAQLMRLLESLISDASQERLACAARWISAFEDARLHADVWELQQFVWRWREKLAKTGGSELERAAARALAEKLRFSGAAFSEQDAATT